MDDLRPGAGILALERENLRPLKTTSRPSFP